MQRVGQRTPSALLVDSEVAAAFGSDVSNGVEPEITQAGVAQAPVSIQIGFFAPKAMTLLHRDKAEHVIGVQFLRTAPERGLEDMAHIPARAVWSCRGLVPLL